MSLTSKERVLAQLSHQETDVIPYTLGFEPGVAERLDAYYGNPAWRARLDNAIVSIQATSLDLYVDETIQPLSTDVYGTIWRTDRRPTHLEQPALKTASLAGYAFPAIDQIFQPGWQAKALAAIAPLQDHFVVTGYSFGLFERTWVLRGFDNALVDAAADPDFYAELVGRITEHQLAIVERLVTLPVDGIFFSDDWGYQNGVLLGAKRWRRLIKPGLARLYASAHAAGKVVINHCCGAISEILPDLIEIGLDVYESVQPEARNNNPYELKRMFGDRLTFWGGLGSQSTVPFGTPGEIRAEVARLCREMGRGGGYILAPAKSLQPETPPANCAAVVESFVEQGIREERRSGTTDKH